MAKLSAARARDMRRQETTPSVRQKRGPAVPVGEPEDLAQIEPGTRSGQEATALRSERILEVVLLDGCSVYVRRSSSTNGMYVVDRRAKMDGGMDRWPEIVVAACHDHR